MKHLSSDIIYRLLKIRELTIISKGVIGMGEYIKHPALNERVKIGVYKGFQNIEAYYPIWVLEKFLSSGYEPKETIQSFLDDAEKVQWHDYKQFEFSSRLRVIFPIKNERFGDLIEKLVAEGSLILIYGEPNNPETLMYYTSSFAMTEVLKASMSAEMSAKVFMELETCTEELDVQITDETTASEQRGYDVDVWDTYDAYGNKGDRNENLTVVGFTSKEDAEVYIAQLAKGYAIHRLDK
jgi:hypothetical protein